MTALTTCIWYDTEAEEAAAFYASVFSDATVGTVVRYGDEHPERGGQVLTVEFTIGTQKFLGLNGGPQFPQTEAVSFQIECANQAEVDRYWDALQADGGEPSQCGWLKDRFGVSWQVVPVQLPALLSDPDPARANAAAEAMLGMQKLVIADVVAAAAAASDS